jgi:hypothetical protein
MPEPERAPFVLRWVLPFGAVLMVTAMAMMFLFLRKSPPPAGTPTLEARAEHLVFHPAGRHYLILATVEDGRVSVHIPRGGGAASSALVEDGSGTPLAELPRTTVYAFFSERPIPVASVMGRLARGVTEVPDATTAVFHW